MAMDKILNVDITNIADSYGSPLVPLFLEEKYFGLSNLCGGRHIIIWRPPHSRPTRLFGG